MATIVVWIKEEHLFTHLNFSYPHLKRFISSFLSSEPDWVSKPQRTYLSKTFAKVIL